MVKEALVEIFKRDLNKLKDEINLYADEQKLWVVKEEINNSAGNLCLHLIGNLNHFIGAILGKSGYERNRSSEFTSKNVTRAELVNKIEKTMDVVQAALNNLSDEDFEKDFSDENAVKAEKTDFTLLSLLAHLNYHLGQINYHRRLIA